MCFGGGRGVEGAGGEVPFQTDLLSKHRVGCIATAVMGFGLQVSVGNLLDGFTLRGDVGDKIT